MNTQKNGAFAFIKPLALIFSVAILAIVSFLAVRSFIAPHDMTNAELGNVSGTAAIGGPFELVDQTGALVTDADFRGQYMLIYFGYTYCPDVCPTSLNRNMAAIDMLGDDASEITPILISIDPERDTPAQLSEYVEFFGSGLIGLTGSMEQVAKAAQAYRVYFAKANEGSDEADSYLVDHSSFSYLMDTDGTFVDFFRHSLTPDEVASRLRNHLG
jgi:protein SCO1/2